MNTRNMKFVNLLSSSCQHTVNMQSTIYSVIHSALCSIAFSPLPLQTQGLKARVVKGLDSKSTQVSSSDIHTYRKRPVMLISHLIQILVSMMIICPHPNRMLKSNKANGDAGLRYAPL